MKAAFVNGELHGQVKTVPKALQTLTWVKELMEPAVFIGPQSTPTDPKAGIIESVYRLRHEFFADKKSRKPDVLVYCLDPCTYNDEKRELWKVVELIRRGDPLVGLYHWQHQMFEQRLAYNAAFRQKLWAIRTTFDCAIADISGRRTSERLLKRFPEVYP
jgi:hypothetical protein